MKAKNIEYRILNIEERGQSLFELVLSVGISALIIVVLVSLVNNALQNAAFSRNETLASKYSQAATEWLRGQRDSRIDTFISNARSSPSSWCLRDVPLSDTSWNLHNACTSSQTITNTPFTRQVNFTVRTVSGKTIVNAEVRVAWTDSKGTHAVTSSTDFSDWRQR